MQMMGKSSRFEVKNGVKLVFWGLEGWKNELVRLEKKVKSKQKER